MKGRYNFIVLEEDAGERLDLVLTKYISKHQTEDESPSKSNSALNTTSRSRIASWIESGLVSIDEKIVFKPSLRVVPGMSLLAKIPSPRELSLLPDAEVPFQVVFEDEQLLVIDKPAGVVVHPGAGCSEKTLVHGLLHHFGDTLPRIGDAFRPGIVHRLDKGTSGLMVVAKSEAAYYSLSAQLKPPRTMTREYLAFTNKLPRSGVGSITAKDGQSGVIDLPISRHPTQRTKMSTAKTVLGRKANTMWKVKENLKYGYLLELRLGTGRTHQIRVHLQAVNAPIIGDPLYGPSIANLPQEIRPLAKSLQRQALHAFRLSFLHPETKEEQTFYSALPKDLSELLARMDKLPTD